MWRMYPSSPNPREPRLQSRGVLRSEAAGSAVRGSYSWSMTARPRWVISCTVGPIWTDLKALSCRLRATAIAASASAIVAMGMTTSSLLVWTSAGLRGREDEHADKQSEGVPHDGRVAEQVEAWGECRRGELDGQKQQREDHGD